MSKPSRTNTGGVDEASVLAALAHAGHYLPDQGPIGVFVHHNTLHAFAHLPFHQAVAQGAALFGTEPYMPEAWFRQRLAEGRIEQQDLIAAVADGCAEDAAVVERPSFALRRRELRLLALRHPMAAETPEGLRYLLEEEGLVSPMTPAVEALWARCRQLAAEPAEGAPPPAAGTPEAATGFRLGHDGRHRDLLLRLTGEDTDAMVHPLLIRLCAAYLDMGMAYWPMPDRAQGFYPGSRALLTGALPSPAAWLREAAADLRAQAKRGDGPADVAVAALAELGVTGDSLEDYLTRLVLALPGWTGMMHRLERHPEDRAADSPPASLLDVVAVRLVLERAATRWLARSALGWNGPLAGLAAHAAEHHQGTLRIQPPWSGDHDRAYRLFRLLHAAGISPEGAAALDEANAHALLAELDDFDELARRRTFQEAYERHHRRMILDAMAEHRPFVDPSAGLPPGQSPPRFQLLLCIDEREESLRRHIEELEPGAETFGAVGFFGVAMDFRGLDDAHHAALCPVVVTPGHEVEEHPHDEDRHLHARRMSRRRLWARLAHALSVGSRSLVRGQLFTVGVGPAAALPMTGRVLFPRAAGRLRRRLAELLLPRPRTTLRGVRQAEERSARGKLLGFTIEEKVERVASLLAGMGLVEGFAALVVVLGHGSSCLNNPHASAYDCGACNGRRGGPNARLLADMANHPEVRAGLRARGVHIPDSTWFLGGMHDTASDAVSLYDTDRVPAHLAGELHALRRLLDQARARDAHERCRRFESFGRHRADPAATARALRHVEARAEHLAEPRPECGHATNAVCVVGRRALTRGLFLDRRAFLVSYDPHRDPDGTILERTLVAVGPVGAGINLEYYFSFVDNEGYGCGTKLPHNITGLLGVMNGAASDLRTGLPWQMVEIHEPVRLLTIVEATPETLLAIAGRQPGVRELVVNRWIQLVAVDPDTGAMHVFGDRGFEPYAPTAGRLQVVPSSAAWYAGHAEHLPPVRISAHEKERVHAA